MSLSIIVAIAENGVIGREGDLPWRLAADLRRFKRLTMGSALVMGRKTWDSIGRPLPGRTSVVITRQADFQPGWDEVIVAASWQEALAGVPAGLDSYVIGGSSIYALALPDAQRLFLTRVHAAVEGDTYFPEFSLKQWEMVETTHHPADAQNDFDTTFEVYHRQRVDD